MLALRQVFKSAVVLQQQQHRLIHLNSCALAKKVSKAPAGKVARGKQVPEPEPESDAHRLVTFCCGANKFIEGEDPQLLPADQYPEWLWTLYIGEKKDFRELSPDTKDYWYSVRENQMKLKVAEKTGQKGFFRKYRVEELNFVSRLPAKN